MTTVTNGHILQKRNVQIGKSCMPSAAGVWYENKPLSTQLLNSYTLLIPDGENFIIRTCSRYLKEAQPELVEELKALFYQEGSHSREHGHLLKSMQAEGLGLEGYCKLCNVLFYKILEPLTPLKLRLATAAAIEHHNAIIATFFLRQNLLDGIHVKELRKLFLWHFIEEIEHKETVYKLLKSVSSSWTLRALGLMTSFSTFVLSLMVGAILFGMKAGLTGSRGFWREFVHEHFGRHSFLAAIMKGSWKYLEPRFYPSREESFALLNSAIDELNNLDGTVLRAPDIQTV